MTEQSSGMFDGRAKSVSFGKVGAGVGQGFRDAVVLRVLPLQDATVFDDRPGAEKKTKYWPNKRGPNGELIAIRVLPLLLLTSFRDPSIPFDDGQRTLYLEEGDGKTLFVRSLLKQAGRRGDPRLGDVISMVCTNEDFTNKGKRTYEGAYRLGDAQSIATAKAALGIEDSDAGSGMFSTASAEVHAPATTNGGFAGQVHDVPPAPAPNPAVQTNIHQLPAAPAASFAPPAPPAAGAPPQPTPEQIAAFLAAQQQAQAGARPGYDPAPNAGQPVGAGAATGGGFFPPA